MEEGKGVGGGKEMTRRGRRRGWGEMETEGEEMGGGCEGRGNGRDIDRGENEEERGGDMERMGKRKKVRLWGMQG